MGLLEKFRAGLHKSQAKLVHEIKRIVSGSSRLTGTTLEELEQVLIASDLGLTMTSQIVTAVKHTFETQGRQGPDIFSIAQQEVERCLAAAQTALFKANGGLTVVSVVGVNGTGKTTTCAKLAYWLQAQRQTAALAACDTFRAAAIEQIQLWGERLQIPVIAGQYGADPAAVAHDAVAAAISRQIDYLFVDTAGRLHTKHNLMQELQKLHRVMNKQLPGAPQETLLVLDAATGMNAIIQAREFNKATPLTGIVVTKIDGTSKGGMVIAIQNELGLPVKFIGLGEQPDDLQPFDAAQFASALFSH